MKNLYRLFLLLVFPSLLQAQTIHGVWSGTLVMDSTHRIQNFELGLSEYRGKITGYTYTTFIDNDTFYYSIKRIKAERQGGKLIIEDDQMVGNNFPERASKHVKQTTVFPLINDSTIDIANGRWSTNQTKKYYSIGGSATVKEQDDEKKSDLLAHLQEANIKTDIAVNRKQENEDGAIAKNPPVIKQRQNTRKVQENKNADVVKNSETETSKIKTAPEINVGNKTEEAIPSTPNDKQSVVSAKVNTTQSKESIKDPVPGQTGIANNSIPAKQIKNNSAKDYSLSQTKPSQPKENISEQLTQKKDQPIAKDPEKQKNSSTVSTPLSQNKELIGENKVLPSIVADRKNENIQDLYFKNDSLVLSLYDNGIVDGDTVSVFLNGGAIVSKQMLKTVATKRTIYISPEMDSVQLVLFAENLGTIPPNTGLLTVRDGDDVYQVHFTADLQKNASLILRRRK